LVEDLLFVSSFVGLALTGGELIVTFIFFLRVDSGVKKGIIAGKGATAGNLGGSETPTFYDFSLLSWSSPGKIEHWSSPVISNAVRHRPYLEHSY